MLLISLLIFSLGLIFGSFVSALTWRYPRKISIAKGRSICPNCHHIISWYDNIPLLSYLLLRGRCRNCHKIISVRYPLIELSTALGFLVIWVRCCATSFRGQSYGVSVTALYLGGLSSQGVHSILVLGAHLTLFLILEIIFIIDLENQVIPDFFIFAGILVTLFMVQNSLFSNLFAGFACALFLLLIHLITRGRGMGLGDVKFALLGGIVLGPILAIPWLFLAFLTGGATGIILILTGKAKLKSRIAFGPFLVLALLIVKLWSGKIDALLGLLL